MMSKISSIAQLLVRFCPIREMAVNFNDYFEFPLEHNTLQPLECKKIEVFDSLYTEMLLRTNFHV